MQLTSLSLIASTVLNTSLRCDTNYLMLYKYIEITFMMGKVIKGSVEFLSNFMCYENMSDYIFKPSSSLFSIYFYYPSMNVNSYLSTNLQYIYGKVNQGYGLQCRFGCARNQTKYISVHSWVFLAFCYCYFCHVWCLQGLLHCVQFLCGCIRRDTRDSQDYILRTCILDPTYHSLFFLFFPTCSMMFQGPWGYFLCQSYESCSQPTWLGDQSFQLYVNYIIEQPRRTTRHLATPQQCCQAIMIRLTESLLKTFLFIV